MMPCSSDLCRTVRMLCSYKPSSRCALLSTFGTSRSSALDPVRQFSCLVSLLPFVDQIVLLIFGRVERCEKSITGCRCCALPCSTLCVQCMSVPPVRSNDVFEMLCSPPTEMQCSLDRCFHILSCLLNILHPRHSNLLDSSHSVWLL